MTNYSLFLEAAEIAENRLLQDGISEDEEELIGRAASWYDHTQIHDSTTLAALAISGSYQEPLCNEEIAEIKSFFFDEEIPEEN